MAFPPYLGMLSHRREGVAPDGQQFVTCGKLFFGDPLRGDAYKHPALAVWVGLWGIPPSLKCSCSAPDGMDDPPFIHHDLELTVREYVVEGERRRVKRVFGYIDTRENSETGRAFYVVTLHTFPVVHPKSGMIYLHAKTKD